MLFFRKKYIKDEDYLLKAREIIMGKLMFASLPFRVWNHFFFVCERSQYCIDMCLYCSKISDHINEHLHVPIEQFPISIRDGIVIAEKIHIFAHTNALIYKDNPFGRSKNFGFLSVSSLENVP